jgi:UrcA family protein
MTRNGIIAMILATLSAAATAEPRTATFVVTRADFASPAARANLDRRIGTAIEQVCGSFATIESYQVPEVKACWSSAKVLVGQRLASLDAHIKIQLASH